jgi:hypothetical protein
VVCLDHGEHCCHRAGAATGLQRQQYNRTSIPCGLGPGELDVWATGTTPHHLDQVGSQIECMEEVCKEPPDFGQDFSWTKCG